MFDLTTSPEFMDALRRACAVAIKQTVDGTGAKTIDPENEWLTMPEAQTFLRLSESAFRRLREKLKDDKREHELVVSYLPGVALPRYQLASLQKLLRKGAPALPADGQATKTPDAARFKVVRQG